MSKAGVAPGMSMAESPVHASFKPNTSTALFALGKALSIWSALRLLGDDELRVGTQCGLHNADVFVQYAI